jgi:hypothetical protein
MLQRRLIGLLVEVFAGEGVPNTGGRFTVMVTYTVNVPDPPLELMPIGQL